MNIIPTSTFSKSSNNTHLATEASIVDWPPLYAPPSFTLLSEWTGREIKMEKVYTEQDEEGDIILWMYRPACEDEGVNITVEVFND